MITFEGKKKLFTGFLISLLFVLFMIGQVHADFINYEIDEEPEFHQAVIKGDTEKVKNLLRANPDLVNSKDKKGFTPLDFAAMKRRTEIVKLLVKNGAKPNILNPNNVSPLHMASYRGYLDIVKTLVENGANVNIKESGGSTPLHYSVYSGNLELMEYLIDNGADLYAEDSFHDRPIDLVISFTYDEPKVNRYKTLKLFFSKGIDVNKRSKSGQSPILLETLWAKDPQSTALLLENGLDVYEKKGGDNNPLIYYAANPDIKTIKFLLYAGIDPNEKCYRGMTPTLNSASNMNPEVIKLFEKFGGNIYEKDDDYRTALHYAAESGSTVVIDYLLKKGFKIDARTNEGNTPLHLAAMNGRFDAVKLLVNSGAKVEARDNWGVTPLMKSGMERCENHAKIVKYLISKGADPLSVNKGGDTILSIYSIYPHKEWDEIVKTVYSPIIDVFKQTASGSPISKIIMFGTPESLKFLRAKGIEINPKTAPDLLINACATNNSSMIGYLIDLGYNVNHKDSKGNTLLHTACYPGMDTVSELIKGGADVEARNINGETPFITLCRNSGSLEQMNLLIKAGADINASDNQGNTPLHYLVYNERSFDLKQFLKVKGLKIDVKNKENKTPLDVAIEKKNEEMIKALKKHNLRKKQPLKTE